MKIDEIRIFLISILTLCIMAVLIIISQVTVLEQWLSIIVDVASAVFGVGSAVTFTKSISITTSIKNKSKDNNKIKIEGQSQVGQASIVTQQGNVINNFANNDNENIIKAIEIFTESFNKLQINNTAEIVKLTIEQLKTEKNNVNKPSDDWLMKFFRYSQEVSDLDFQKVWSDVLLYEMKNPNSIKVRALEELSWMSKEEMLILEKLSRYSFKFGDIIGIPTDYTNDVQFIELSQLADIGIIKSESMMTWQMTIDTNSNSNIVNKYFVILISNETEKSIKIDIPIRGYTEIGSQIIKSIGLTSSDMEFKNFASHLKDKHKQLKISLHRINYIKDNQINYQKQDLLSPIIK